jgi:hypothetical protein
MGDQDMDNSNVRTLEDLIQYGQTSEFARSKLSLYHVEDGYVLLDSLVYQKYESVLRSVSVEIELTDQQVQEYKYRPELLSVQLYDTPNLSHLILFLNNCAVYEFFKKKLLLLPPSHVGTTLQDILMKESNNLKNNFLKTVE